MNYNHFDASRTKECIYPGIYKIVNKTNGKIYIGSSLNVDKRIENHYKMLSKNKHNNKALQSDYNNGDMFESVLISEECGVLPEDLLTKENDTIRQQKEIGQLYNVVTTGMGTAENERISKSNLHKEARDAAYYYYYGVPEYRMQAYSLIRKREMAMKNKKEIHDYIVVCDAWSVVGEVKRAAKKNKQTLNEFVMQAVKEKMQRQDADFTEEVTRVKE